MSNEQIDLLSLFKKVSKTLQANQETLNESDEYNHDHGDHMVEIFEVITTAMKAKKESEPAEQLEYAAQLLRQKSSSGSAKTYAEGLMQASKQVTGKPLTTDTVLTLLQTLLSGGEANITNSNQDVGSVLGQFLGGNASQAPSTDEGFDLGDLLGAGLSYMQAKQAGSSSLEALSKALLSGSQYNSNPYRTQSAQLIANTVLQTLSGLTKTKKK